MIDYEKIISPVVSALPPSGIRKFFDIVAEMDDAISLGVGEPDFTTPWAIREAGKKMSCVYIRLKKDRRTTPQMPDLWNCVKKSAITMTENSI